MHRKGICRIIYEIMSTEEEQLAEMNPYSEEYEDLEEFISYNELNKDIDDSVKEV